MAHGPQVRGLLSRLVISTSPGSSAAGRIQPLPSASRP
ncbi:hypothetical protein RKD25_002061 [Streptomyces sp. SAI-124]